MENSTASNKLPKSLNKTGKEFAGFPFYDIRSHNVSSLAIPIYLPLSNTFNAFAKRFLDLLISLVIIITILTWLLPVLAIIIWVDSDGPIFFFQCRTKSRGKTFACIKLRTMFVNPEADIVSATENDYRITKVGKQLRKYHLDELPQFINVFTGDMSIVGPRPHMIKETSRFEKLFPEYAGRHRVKPGITGLAQSLGYFGSTEDLQKIKDRVYLDLKYIRHWSILLDIKIMLRTCALILGI